MVRQNCFAYGSATENGCKVLIKRDCDKCKFFKTTNDDEIEKLNCELRSAVCTECHQKNF